MKTAIFWAAVFLVSAAVGFAVLVFLALNVPDNLFLRSSHGSALKTYMPEQNALPADMLFIRDEKSTNEDISKNYPNPKEMLERLDRFGRQKGYLQEYVSKDRCKQVGLRSVSLDLVSLKDPAGAQQYLQWTLDRDREGADQYQDLEIGDSGYLLWQTQGSLCADTEKELNLKISFRRNNFLASIYAAGVKGRNQQEDLLRSALVTARALDERLQKMPEK